MGSSRTLQRPAQPSPPALIVSLLPIRVIFPSYILLAAYLQFSHSIELCDIYTYIYNFFFLFVAYSCRCAFDSQFSTNLQIHRHCLVALNRSLSRSLARDLWTDYTISSLCPPTTPQHPRLSPNYSTSSSKRKGTEYSLPCPTMDSTVRTVAGINPMAARLTSNRRPRSMCPLRTNRTSRSSLSPEATRNTTCLVT